MDLSLGVLDDTMAQMVNDKDAAGLSLFSDAQVTRVSMQYNMQLAFISRIHLRA